MCLLPKEPVPFPILPMATEVVCDAKRETKEGDDDGRTRAFIRTLLVHTSQQLSSRSEREKKERWSKFEGLKKNFLSPSEVVKEKIEPFVPQNPPAHSHVAQTLPRARVLASIHRPVDLFHDTETRERERERERETRRAGASGAYSIATRHRPSREGEREREPRTSKHGVSVNIVTSV